jgi:hypothetical protein
MSSFGGDDLENILGKALADERDVPPEWRDAARAAYTWRTVDAELLALTYDSLVEAGAAVRGVETRTLEFGTGEVTLEVELVDGRFEGRLHASDGAEVVVEHADGGRTPVQPDASGFFVVEVPGDDPVRFALRSGGFTLVTEWVTR